MQERNAKFLLSNRVLSQCGDGMLQTALATFVLFSPQRATSPAQITAIFAALLLPYSVIGPFVGVLIDKWSRRSILIYANLIRLCAVTLIALTVAKHTSNFTLGFLVLICLGINRFLLATHASSLPHVVAPHLLVNANAIFPTMGTLGSTIGAASGIGIQHTFGNIDQVNAGIIALAGLISLCAAASAHYVAPRNVLGPHNGDIHIRNEFRNVFNEIGAAIQDIKLHSAVINAMGSVVLQRVTFGAVTVHTLLLVRLQWHSSINPNAALNDFGLVAACAALGAGVAAVTSAVLFRENKTEDKSSHRRLRGLVGMNLGSISLAIIALGIGTYCETKQVMFVAAFSLGLCGQFLKITADTTIQNELPDVERGRTFSIFDMVINVALVIGVALFALIHEVRDNSAANSVAVCALMSGCLLLNVKRHRLLRNTN